MKNQLNIQQFHSKEFGSIDILMEGDKLYFPATECAAILGYRDPHKAVKQHTTADGWVNRPVIDTLGRTQEKKYISEGNPARGVRTDAGGKETSLHRIPACQGRNERASNSQNQRGQAVEHYR